MSNQEQAATVASVDQHFNNQTQQQRIAALLEAAGIPPHGVDGALLRNPAVLDHLSSSVNKALIDAKLAMNKADFDDNIRGLSFPEKSDNSYTSLKKALRALNCEDYQEYLVESCTNGSFELVQLLLDLDDIPERMCAEKVKVVYHQYHKVNFQRFQANGDERAAKGEMTPLMEAAYNGHEDIVTLLINHGVDINAKSSTGNTALMYACCRGHETIVHNLLCAGANTEIFNENGHTPLMEAASGAHVNCAKLLVCHGAEINCASNEFKESALTLACYKGNYDMVHFLLLAGADREHKTDEMHTALMEASMDGHTDVARLLLESGCNVNMPPESFESPLTLAACGGHTDLARLLIERGANLEEVNDEGYTALMEAAREGHEKVVQVLIEHGANVNQQTEETQETALTLACCAGFNECARLLIEAGGDIEKGASTPLMEAAQEGYDDLVDFLIRSGAKVTAVANNGDTALDLAAENGHKKICEAMLRAGAKLEHRSEGGRTPLMRAARQGHESTVDYLIEVGANVNFYSENNEHTVLSFACSHGQLGVVQRLLQAGANPNAKLKDNSTMLIEAAKGGHTQVVQLLLDPNRAGARYVLNEYPQEQRPEEINFEEVVDVLNSVKDMISQPGEGILPPSPIGAGDASLDQLAANAKEAQRRLEALELKIKSAFDQRVDGSATNQELLAKEIAQIQKEKKHKQNLMRELQDVERQIHQKMLDKVSKTIPKNSMDRPADVIYPPEGISTMPNWPASHPDNVFEEHLRPEDIPDLLNIKEESWGFSPEELNEIMKHIQVLGPAIQKAIQRHLQNPAPVAELTGSESTQSVVRSVQGNKQTTTTSAVKTTTKTTVETQQHILPSVTADQPAAVRIGIQSGQETPPIDETSIADGINDKTDSNHDTPLSLACQGGHTELVQLLVSKGAELEHRDKKGFTPLILAATGGFSEICELLIEAGADVEAQSDRTKDTPLSLACSGGKKEVVELLLDRGAKKEHRNVSDYTPLSLAASGGYIEIIKILLDAGAEINSRTASKLGISPLMLAAMNGHLEAVTLLLDRGADINAQIETNKNTALTLACFQGRAEVVEKLLDRRANVEHRAKTGLTPLMEAASGGYVDVGRVLLEKGAEVNALPVPTSRDTALTIASDKGHKLFVDLLLKYSAHVDIKNKKGDTPIWLASHSGHLDVVQKLIEHKADPSLCDTRNVSPLMAAFKKGHFKVVKYLVKKVTQFPSDTECYNYIQSIKDKDQDLKMKCANCVEIIIQAKVKQEKEAERHAQELLEKIDQEHMVNETKRKKKEKQKHKKAEKIKKEKEIKAEEEQRAIDALVASEPTTPPKPAEPMPTVDTTPPSPHKSKSRKQRDQARVPQKEPEPQPKVEMPPQPEDNSDRVPTIEANEPAKPVETSQTKSEKKGKKERKKQQQQQQQQQAQQQQAQLAEVVHVEGVKAQATEQPEVWKDVKPVRKKEFQKMSLGSNYIARVIGRSGCNVNAIRDVTGTHIDIEKPKKGGGDRTITIRGTPEQTTLAKKLMDELIKNPDMEIDDIIQKYIPNAKTRSRERVSEVEEDEPEPKSLNIEKILAAVQQSEKDQREKEKKIEARKKKQAEEAKARQDALIKAQQEQEKQQVAVAPQPQKPVAASSSLPPTPRPKKVAEPVPIQAPKPHSTPVEDAVSQHLRNLRKRDEMERNRTKEDENSKIKVEVVQKQVAEMTIIDPMPAPLPPAVSVAPIQPQLAHSLPTPDWSDLQNPNVDIRNGARTHPGPIGPPKSRQDIPGSISPYATHSVQPPSNSFQPSQPYQMDPSSSPFRSPGQGMPQQVVHSPGHVNRPLFPDSDDRFATKPIQRVPPIMAPQPSDDYQLPKTSIPSKWEQEEPHMPPFHHSFGPLGGGFPSEPFNDNSHYRERPNPQVQPPDFPRHPNLPLFDAPFERRNPGATGAIGEGRPSSSFRPVSNMPDFNLHSNITRPMQKHDWDPPPRLMTSSDLGGFQAPRWSQPTSQPSHPNLGLGGSSYMPSGGAGDPSLQLRQDYMSTHQQMRMDGPSLLDRNGYTYHGFQTNPTSQPAYNHQQHWNN